MRKLSLFMALVLLLSGCATHYVKPDVTVVESHADLKTCKATGLRVGGWVMVGVGLALVPIGLLLAIPGGVMVSEADKKEKECMHSLGYQQEG